MASCTRIVLKVAGCQRQLLSSGGATFMSVTHTAHRNLPVRTFAAARAFQKKDKKEEKKEEEKKERRIIDDSDRHKPYGKTAWTPMDDVYIPRYYPRTVYDVADAIDLLKRYQVLDFTPPAQPLYIDLKLNMKLEKKKKVDQFVSIVHLPFPFNTKMNKVLVFTEDENQVKVAKEQGADEVGGAELVQKILDDEISADFYIAVPEIITKIVVLKNKLRKKFPKSKRGSVGSNIPKMLQLFKVGHEYMVESECYIRTQIATLDMPREQILANLQKILQDICSHRPADMGPFIERAIMASHTSESLWFKSEDVVGKTEETEK